MLSGVLLGPLCTAAWQTVREQKAVAIDALDFVARLLGHVPDPGRHLVHYYGAYSNVVRGKLKARSQAQQAERRRAQEGAR